MRPVLFEIPLPPWRLPVGPALVALALAALAVAGFGYRRRAVDLATLGLLGAAASLAFAFLHWGRTFTPSSLPVMSYGALLATSLALGWVLTQRLAGRSGIERDASAHAYVVAAIGGIVGARLLYVVTNPEELRDPIAALGVGAGGLVAYGGFVGGFLGSLFALRRLRVPFLPWADAAAPSVALGLGLTRLGCYLYGCDFGRPLASETPLARLGTFPRWADGSLAGSGSPAFVEHVVRRGLSPLASESLPVHPTQLYEASLGLVLFALSLALFSRRRRYGELFGWLALAYGAGRFVIEFFRDDPERGHFGPLAPGLVWAGIGFAIIALSLGLALIPRFERGAAIPVIALAASALLLTWLARATAFANETNIALSTSQWLGLATGLAAGVALRRLPERAERAVRALEGAS
jgi:phosphatidylglycerol:prolipoprotein diacylglycerol transferase